MIFRYKRLSDVDSNSISRAQIVKDMGSIWGWLEVFCGIQKERLMVEDIDLILRDEIWPGHQDL